MKENEIEEEAANMRQEVGLKEKEHSLALQEKDTEIKRIKSIMVQVEEERA